MEAHPAGAPKATGRTRTPAPSSGEEHEVSVGALQRRRGGGGRRRVLLAFGAAVVALVTAGFVAIGPASESRGVYHWPAAGAVAPSGASDGRMLFAPLLLSRHTPAVVSVVVPCAVVRAAALGGGRFTVFATSKNVPTSGLWLVVDGQQLRLGVGGTALAEGPWPTTALDDPGCRVSAGFRGEKWHLGVGRREFGRGRSPAPVVTGLFTELPRPVQGEPGLSVRVVTALTGSSPSARQLLLTVIAAAAGVVALLLLVLGSGSRRRRARARAGAAVRSGVRALTWLDGVVIVALGAWWFFGPVLYDDGWVFSTAINFPNRGAFSNYYDIFDAQYPLGFLHFLFHYESSHVSTSLLWMRFPVLLVGIAMWALVRTYLGRLRPEPGMASRVALACVFLVFWFAWLSTLRPEPMVALLAVVVLVAVQRFSQTAALGPLTVAALAAAVAVTLHPVGVIALAPLLVAIPSLWRWTRGRGATGAITLVTVGLIAAVVLVLLLTADTDFTLWRQNQHLFAANDLNALTWRDELYRYQLLLDTSTIWGPVVRRASAVFGLVAVALFVTRPARHRDAAFDLPVMSLIVGVVLMALTPSKWPWQLGALGGFAALASAAELGRLGLEPVGGESRNRRSLLVLGVTLVASAVAWRGGAFFGDFAVLDVDFGRGGSRFLGIDLSSPVPWLVLAAGTLGAGVVIATCHRRLAFRPMLDSWLAHAGIWAVPVTVGVVVVAALGLFVTDAFASSPGWSLPRQNYDDLTGRTCGLADDVGVADPSRGTALEVDPTPAEAAQTGVLPAATAGSRVEFTAAGSPTPPPDVDLDPRWGSRISGDQDTGVFASPWFTLGSDTATRRIDRPGVAIFTAGKPNSSGNTLVAQFGRRDGQTIRTLGLDRVTVPDSDTTWQPSALTPPRRADRVRMVAVDATSSPGGWLAFSGPRRVRYQSLATVLTEPRTTALIGPAVRFYFPCASNSRIEHGVAQVPDFFATGVTDRDAGLWPQSPTAGVRDLYRSQRLLIRTSNRIAARELHVDRVIKHPTPAIIVPFDD
jgi:arabinosyltransferase C